MNIWPQLVTNYSENYSENGLNITQISEYLAHAFSK